MELWIRSQNKKNLQIVQEIEYRDTGKEPRLVAENEIILGKYATKERALEVLDEIQNILKPKYILDTSSIKPDGDFYEENGVIFQNYDANSKIEELSTFVYQMPEN